MARSSRVGAGALIAAALTLLALAAGPAAASTAGGGSSEPTAEAAGRCGLSAREQRGGLGATYTTSLRTSRYSCRRAKSLVRAYHSCRRRNGGADGRCNRRVNRFRCRERRRSSPSQISASVRCSRGRARVSFTYSQFT